MKTLITRSFIYFYALCGLLLIGACSSGGDDEDDPVVNTDYINIESGNLTIGGNELTGSIVVKANCHWTLQKQQGADGDWLTVRPTEGTGNATITVEANSINPSSTDSRKMTLVIKSDGGISRSITVTQTVASEFLSVTPTTLAFDAASGMQEFNISSNAGWTITGKQDWFTLSTAAGSGTQTIQVTVQENTSETEARIPATLTITTNSGEHRVYVGISQEAKITTLDVTPATIDATALAGSYTVQITGTATWTANSNQSWAKIDKSNSKGDATLTVTCEDNASLTERVAIINVVYARKTFSVIVTQAAGTVPALTTVEAIDPTKEGVTLKSSYTSEFPVTEYGFCYGTTVDPTVNGTKASFNGNEATSGDINASLSNLTAATTYYVRAYAISKVGIAYSSNVSFTTIGKLPTYDDNDRPNLIKRR